VSKPAALQQQRALLLTPAMRPLQVYPSFDSGARGRDHAQGQPARRRDRSLDGWQHTRLLLRNQIPIVNSAVSKLARETAI
jgi:hypothetical protein